MLTPATSLTNYYERTVVDYILVHWIGVACDSVSMRATPFKLSTPLPAGRVQPQRVLVVINRALRWLTANFLPLRPPPTCPYRLGKPWPGIHGSYGRASRTQPTGAKPLGLWLKF
jgi:hypothetical protein